MLKIGDKVFRNLQEQVGYNTEQIEKIFETLDGLNVQDNVVSVPDMSYVLTDDELKIVRQAVAFIIYSGELYIKRSEDSTLARFELVFAVSESAGVISLSSKEIQVTLANGGLALVTSSATTYNATKLDTLLSAKADLSGANFSGPITSPSIVENMAGYSFEITPSTYYTKNVVYAGAVKNGNKLTLVACLKVTKTTAIDSQYITLGKFNIPFAVASKIYPTAVTGVNVVDIKTGAIYGGDNFGDKLSVEMYCQKQNDTEIAMNLFTPVQATLNVQYFVRYEVTFLLSNSLI